MTLRSHVELELRWSHLRIWFALAVLVASTMWLIFNRNVPWLVAMMMGYALGTLIAAMSGISRALRLLHWWWRQ